MSWTIGRSVVTALVVGAVLCSQVAATAAPKPPSVDQLRKEFLADSAKLDVAVVTWTNKIEGLSDNTTWAELAKVDQPFANALTKFDGELQRYGATGRVEAGITHLVGADRSYIADLIAPTGQKLFNSGKWETAMTTRGSALHNALNALRGALGLSTPT